MPQRNVFICHASLDEVYVRDLKHYVSPIIKSQLSGLVLWEDNMLFGGQPWNRHIQQAIDDSVAAVVIVSDNLLNSTYTIENEMPRFLALAEDRNFPIYCLYARQSLVDEYVFKVTIGNTLRSYVLTSFHGLNSPNVPIDSIADRRARTNAMVLAARRLVANLKELHKSW